MSKFIFAFLFITSLCYNQNYELEYEIIEFKELKESDFPNKDNYISFLEEFKLVKRFLKGKKVYVYTDKGGHYYKVINSLKSDFSPNPYLSTLFLSYAGLKENFYYQNGNTFYYNSLSPFVTRLDKDDYQWQILRDGISVNGYDCIEAVLNNSSNAKVDISSDNLKILFTNDFGISAGTTVFANIPGVIVMLENKFLKLKLSSIKPYNGKILMFDKFIDNKKVLNHTEAQDYYKKATEHLRN
jgi:GLPGLI family protein